MTLPILTLKIISIKIFLSLITPSSSSFVTLTNGTDKTREEYAIGQEVVDSVVRKLRRSQIFRDDYDFIKRSAYIETKFGSDPNTFRTDYYGGIWQVPELVLKNTKSEKFESYHKQIKSSFEIDWLNTKWSDLVKPLYSGLALRLYLQTRVSSMPQTISKQARLWQQVYDKRDTQSNAKFISEITEFETNAKKCKGLFDLTILLDGSGSVGEEDYKKSKDFVAELFATYSSSDVRKSFILFGDEAYMIFPLNNSLTQEELLETVQTVGYPNQATNTNAGILMAVEMIKDSIPRAGIPSIMIVFTDGESNVGDGVTNIKFAKQLNLTTFAIGIGGKIDQGELLEIAYNDSSHVVVVRDFNTLKTLGHRLNAETCLVSHKPNLNEEVVDTLSKDEDRYYTYYLTPDGVTIVINNTEGGIQGFYSFTDQNPSESVNDGVLYSGTTFINLPKDTWDSFAGGDSEDLSGNIYINIKGKEDGTIYKIRVVEGDGKPKATDLNIDMKDNTNDTSSTEEGAGLNKNKFDFGGPKPDVNLDKNKNQGELKLDLGGVRTPLGFGQGMLKCKDNQVAFQPFPGRCDLYTLCACGVKVLLECAPGLYFDPSNSACNFIQLVKCQNTL